MTREACGWIFELFTERKKLVGDKNSFEMCLKISSKDKYS